MKSIFYYLLGMCFLLGMISCEKVSNSKKSESVFRYNESASIQTLDPAFARNMAIIWPTNQLFNGLVQLDDSLNIQPDIAQRWEVSQDGRQLLFTLRRDVYFHPHVNFGADSTRTVTARDFKYSFDRLLDENIASPGAWIFNKVASIKALNDTVLEINLTESFPAFLGLLSMRYASVVPQEVVEDDLHDFRSHPIGTGPFLFKYWEENVKLVLRKNARYFEKDEKGVQLPYLEAVSITFLPDKQSAYFQFLQGNLDFISGLDPSYKDDIINAFGVLNEKYRDRFIQIEGPYLNTEYLGINLESDSRSPLLDKRIREALTIGFDRDKMIKYLRNNLGNSQVSGMIPEGLAGKSMKLVRKDINKAKKLVDDYCKEHDLRSVSLTLSTNSSYVDIAQYLQREWKELGVDLTVDILPPSTLRQSISTGKVPFFRGSWIADYPDAENYLALFYGINKPPYGPNYVRYSNAKYDELYKKSLLINDVIQREQFYQELDDYIVKDIPVIVLFYDKAVRFTSKNIRGLGINPMNNLFLKRVYKEQ